MDCWFWTARVSSLAVAIGAIVTAGGCAKRASLPSLGGVPEFTLTDQTGAEFVSAPMLAGRVWVADFFFTTCPGPCPRMSSQMHQLQTALAAQGIRLVSMTVDPDHDTPPVLAEYSKHFEAQAGVWFFLTGPREALNRLDRDVFKLGQVDGSLDHSTRFILVDRKSQVRGYYLTSEADAIARLIADAKSLL
jgi:protein SCO1